MIEVRNLNKTYDRNSRMANQALHDISLALPNTGFICIVGPSGCGKTSLLNALGGLDQFDSGTISTEHISVSRYGTRDMEQERNHSFGYIFQNYYLLSQHSVAYNVFLGLHVLDISQAEKLSRVQQALKAVGMERYARRMVSDLSGGQQQRVAIARALARRPRVIFADEPTGNLDEENTIQVCSLLRQISKTSLVIMVTHEERIARFFADRIITLDQGRLVGDSDSWQRGSLAADTETIYAGDFQESRLGNESATIRVLQEPGTAPVNLTVVIRGDQIILKLDDERTANCGRSTESPRITEGSRPILRLETIEESQTAISSDDGEHGGNAKGSLSFSAMAAEARRLMQGAGIRLFSRLLFLIVLTVMVMLAVGDYLEVSSVTPEDFITTDSHILQIDLARGPELPLSNTVYDMIDGFQAYMADSGNEYDFVPKIPTAAQYRVYTFAQMDNLSEYLAGYSYVPLEHLDENDLIYGRMPENSQEIVIDRWVLEELISRDGIIQSGLSDVTDFLGEELYYAQTAYSPTIVGISDCGEPALFLNQTALVTLGTLGCKVITLSELQRLFPGSYDDLILADNECYIVTNNAGESYASRIGQNYTTDGRVSLKIVGTMEADTYASLVVTDQALDVLMDSMATTTIYLYCQDKDGMKEYLAQGLSTELADRILITVTDLYANAMGEYQDARALKLDNRRIVTITILIMCLIMLYLLQRSCIRERIEMIAVYRLLGIPQNRLRGIFVMECVLLSLISSLPASVLTFGIVNLLEQFPAFDIQLLLPWYAAAGCYGVLLVVHLAVSIVPLNGLLRLPPAQLAGKYDF